jgi:hypothetical protein
MWRNTVTIHSVLKKKNYKAKFSISLVLKKNQQRKFWKKSLKKQKKTKQIIKNIIKNKKRKNNKKHIRKHCSNP